MARYHVLFHLDEPSKGRADQVFRNIENLLADFGDGEIEVELVANGGGVKALAQGSDANPEQVAALAAKGVRLVACAHSLSGLGIAREQLFPGVEIVPAGVGELVRKQADGWAYIRP